MIDGIGMGMVAEQALPVTRKRSEGWLLARYGWQALILLCAGIPRLGWLELAEFKADESNALTMAEAIARGQSHPLIGIGSSLGIPNAPFFVYLMAIPELLGRNPIIATGFVGLLDVLAVLATYYFVARYFDKTSAVSAALLFAVSPWAIVYSRKVWEQDALPLFVTLGFFALFEALFKNWRPGILFGCALLTLAYELHPTGLFLYVPAGILVLGCLFTDRAAGLRSWPWLGLGILAALALEAPYLVWNARNGWPLIAVFTHLTGDPPTLDLTALRLAASVAVGNGYPTLATVDNLWRPASVVELALLLGGIALTMREVLTSPSRQRRFAGAAVLVWLATPILLQTRHSVPLYPHYFIVLYPAPFLLMGRTVHAISQPTQLRFDWIRHSAPVLVLIPLAFGAFAFGDYIAALSRGAFAPLYGIPLGTQVEWVAATTTAANGGGVSFGTRSIDLRATFGYLSDQRWQIFDSAHGLGMPAGDSGILVLVDEPAQGAQLAARVLDPARPENLTLPGGPPFLIYRFGGGKVNGVAVFHAVGARFSDGLVLVGYRAALDPRERKLRVDLRWRLPETVPAKSPTVFNHVLDSRGDQVTQLDGVAYPPNTWQGGEEFIAEFLLNAPTVPGPYTLQVGLYDYPSMQRFALVEPPPGATRDALNLDLGTPATSAALTPPGGQG